jgi:predicted translin family RNA/ssDNA-binding protein
MELQGASTIEQQSSFKFLKQVYKTQHKLELPIKHNDPLKRKQQKSETSHSKFNTQPARINDKGSFQQIT